MPQMFRHEAVRDKKRVKAGDHLDKDRLLFVLSSDRAVRLERGRCIEQARGRAARAAAALSDAGAVQPAHRRTREDVMPEP